MTVSVGLIGCGAWGKFILRDLIGLGARVHVVVLNEAALPGLRVAGATSANTDVASIMEPVDGFIVATPISTHAGVIERILPFGRAIFVEKPLSDDVNAARRLVALAGDRIFVMDKWRYHPGIEALRDRARSGALGDVRVVRTLRVGWGAKYSDVDFIWRLLPHDLAIAYEVLGRLPNAQSAWCLAPGRPELGLIARLADADAGPEVVAEISVSHPRIRRSVVVIGDHGAAELADSYADRILVSYHSLSGPLQEPEAISVPTDMPLRREIEAFLKFLQGGPAPRSSAAEGLLAVERISALRALAGLR